MDRTEMTKHRFFDDEIEAARRERIEEINQTTWSTEELQRDFRILGFLSPFVVVERKSDGQKGSLEFRHQPRLYFNWRPDEK